MSDQAILINLTDNRCPVCEQSLVNGALRTHLHQFHQLYIFDNQARAYNDTIAECLQSLCRSPSSEEAWIVLVELAEQFQQQRADYFLANSLTTILSRLSTRRARNIVPDISGSIAEQPLRPEFVHTLSQSSERAARHLALLLMAHDPNSEAAANLDDWERLMLDRDIPSRSQIASLASLLRERGIDAKQRQRLVQAIIANRKPQRSLGILQKLEQITGPRPEIDSVKPSLQEQVSSPCPRCGIELSREQMIDHLWKEHRVLLQGQKIREPWGLMEEWFRAGNGRISSSLLRRCKQMAQVLDPEYGMTRLHRLLLSSGIASHEARRNLTADAQEQQATLCPHCYGLTTVPEPELCLPLNYYQGRLSGGGYCVELNEHQGVTTSLEMSLPDGEVHHGPGPDSQLTVHGAILVAAGPFAILALLFALELIPLSVSPAILVLLTLLLGFFASLIVWGRWQSKRPVFERVIDLAWQRFVPMVLDEEFHLSHSEFLARLAVSSHDHGSPPLRISSLARVLPFLEKQVREHPKVASHLSAVQRLLVNDAVRSENYDPVPLVAKELARCLEGKMPLAYGEALLFEWKTDWWTAGHLARLKVQICDAAFEAGYEVKYLMELGQSYPAFGAVLEIDNPTHLALLRLIWTLRRTSPWEDQAGPARDVFDVAEEPEFDELFEQFPDLLLWSMDRHFHVAVIRRGAANRDEPLELCIVSRGLAIQGVLFELIPREISYMSRKLVTQRGYEVSMEDSRFHFREEPSELLRDLDRWFRYVFRDLLTSSEQVFRWESPDRAAQLRSRGALLCRECRRPMLPRKGKIASNVD